jgi:sorting nexin-4
MLNDEDVFDSITWESPAANAQQPESAAGPGFKQSNSDENPDDPKWEGYLLVSVRDPVKEHAETKDAYVSYLVMAKVRLPIPPAAKIPDLLTYSQQD